jgi:hypothetical protein
VTEARVDIEENIMNTRNRKINFLPVAVSIKTITEPPIQRECLFFVHYWAQLLSELLLSCSYPYY